MTIRPFAASGRALSVVVLAAFLVSTVSSARADQPATPAAQQLIGRLLADKLGEQLGRGTRTREILRRPFGIVIVRARRPVIRLFCHTVAPLACLPCGS